jgi:PAS domain S-box-containing protein
MTKPLLSQLKDVADKAMNSKNIDEGMKYLSTAFKLFSRETNNLKAEYAILKQRFENVNEELEKTNIVLRKKIKERNIVSNYLSSILKNISQGIIFIDSDGVIITINNAAQKILGIVQEKLLFKTFWSNFSDDFFGFSMRKSLNLGISHNLNYITLSSNEKTQKQIEISTTFIHDKYASQGMIVVLRDISEIKRLELVANRNDRMRELGEMAASVTHEIKNPLGGIRGYASLLYRDLENSKHLQEMAGHIIEGTKSLERLVNNVLHFSRPIKATLVPCNISLVIQEIINFIKVDPSFPKEILLECHIPKEKFLVSLDKELFKSAILNLIINATQAIENFGKITISLIKNNASCMIGISDTGKGIEQKNLENIFSPFFTTKKHGNGLGLSETFKIIQAHCGTIDVRSRVDLGTTFTIILPTKG